MAANATFSSADLIGLRTSLTIHAAGGLLVLLTAATLANYKPAGLTWYGARKQRARSDVGVGSGLEPGVSTPRWVRVFGAIVIGFILVVGIMTLVGGHGPGAHVSDG